MQMSESINIGHSFPDELFIVILLVLISLMYLWAVLISNRRLRQWPWFRVVFWLCGMLCAAAAIVGPLASLAHMNFSIHMLGHLLLGMLAPLFLSLAAPATLLLRTLHVHHARHLIYLLKSWPLRMLAHPIVALFLNIGGLWVLYTTNLYSAMHEHILLHIIVHFHVFIAGCLFTFSMIYIDSPVHRFSFRYRASVLIIALAGHGILSKIIYAHPPNGVSLAQAKSGGMIMYYGGDAIDLVLISLLCLQWYRDARPHVELATETVLLKT